MLDGKIVLVTGATRGIGKAFALTLGKAGATVIGTATSEAGANNISQMLFDEKISGKGFVLDVTNNDQISKLDETIKKDFGSVDILVNNAGTTHLPAPMETIEEDEFDRVFNVNCKSVYLTAKHFVPHFKENKSGVILNIASTAGVSPRPNLNWYNSSKGWMILASKTMAVELAPFGIRVNVVNPVAGETPLLKSFLGEDTPEMRGKFLSTIPLGRFSMPEDIASAALFLCSDSASMITGANLEVDGGRTI